MSLPLAEALRACRLHLSALQGALIAARLPVSAQVLQNADDDRIRALDQVILRYLKLQDTLSEQVLRSFAIEILREPLENQPMLDLLDRLERLDFLKTDDWIATRRLCNQLTHDYPEDPERQAALLNLETVVERTCQYRARRARQGANRSDTRRYREAKPGHRQSLRTVGAWRGANPLGLRGLQGLQRSMARRARCWRVRSVLTQEVNVNEAENANSSRAFFEDNKRSTTVSRFNQLPGASAQLADVLRRIETRQPS